MPSGVYKRTSQGIRNWIASMHRNKSWLRHSKESRERQAEAMRRAGRRGSKHWAWKGNFESGHTQARILMFSSRERREAEVRVLDEGHRFQLASLDGDSAIQVLQFVKREGKGYPGNVGHYPGTTSQEVDRALLSRAYYVNAQIPCWQTRVSIWLRGIIIWLYEHRAAKRHKREAPGLHDSVFGETCRKCGHVGCNGECRA